MTKRDPDPTAPDSQYAAGQYPPHPPYPRYAPYPPPPPPPPPPPAPRSKRSSRGPVLIGVAAGVAGAVFGVGVAAPVAWVLAGQATGSVASGEDLAPGGPSAPGDDQDRDEVPGWGDGQFPADPGTPSSMAFEDATAAESKGVVLVDVASRGARGAGTGWVIDDSGLVVTNYHVVSGSTQVRVSDAAGEEAWEADVVGRDAEADVALLRLDDATDLAEVTIDDDDALAVGDDVTAVGNAAGQGFLSASDGDVVGLEENIQTTNPATGATSSLTGLIQTDARVVQGFSGGVLLDDEGEVVGITTAASAGRGDAQSYAVPIEDAVDIVDQIRADDESGSVQIGPSAYLGITVAGRGEVRVQGLAEGGAAEAAGIVPGSLITELDGEPVPDFARLQEVLADFEPGDRITLTWTAPSGETREATVTLGESPQN